MNQRSPWIHRLAIVPIPVLVLAIIALWVANVRVVWTSPTMTWLIHYGPVVLGMAVLASARKACPGKFASGNRGSAARRSAAPRSRRGDESRARAVQHPVGHAPCLRRPALARLPHPLCQPLLRRTIWQVAGPPLLRIPLQPQRALRKLRNVQGVQDRPAAPLGMDRPGRPQLRHPRLPLQRRGRLAADHGGRPRRYRKQARRR